MAVAPKPAMILADANLLVKDVVSASFFDLNKCQLISLHWTPEIEAEYIKHRARLRSSQNKHETRLEDLLWAAERININKKYLVPNATPAGWVAEDTLAGLILDPKYAALKRIPDPDDVHVAMAAAFMANSLNQTVILATHDLSDLPQSILEPFNIVVLHPGIILELLYLTYPKKVSASLLKTCCDFKNPTITSDMFLNSISSQNQFDNPALAESLKIEWA